MSSCSPKLSPELWYEIFLHANLTLEEAISVSKVCRQFHHIILIESLLQRCQFSPIQYDLAVHLNLTNRRNCLANPIPVSQGGFENSNIFSSKEALIEANARFGHTLRVTSSKRSASIAARFALHRRVTHIDSFTISFWLLLTDTNPDAQKVEFSFEDSASHQRLINGPILPWSIVMRTLIQTPIGNNLSR